MYTVMNMLHDVVF